MDSAVQVTGVRQREAWREGVLPPVEQVRDGLWSIPVPIPDNPLRYTLIYAFELPDGVALVDAGWDSEDSWQALVAGLATAGFAPSDVRSVLVTHVHPDHFGLAGRVREASGAWIGMHEADAALVRQDEQRTAEVTRRAAVQLRAAGAPAEVVSEQHRPLRAHLLEDGAEVLISDKDRLELPGWDLHAVWTPGHTPGHLCFREHSHGLLLSGDHVLPRISPNISLFPDHGEDPLTEYLDSLRAVGSLPAEEVLPAHEYRFTGLEARVAELLGHHAERLAEIERAVSAHPGSTAYELTGHLTWSRPFSGFSPFLSRMALRETLSHLALLETGSRVRSTGEDLVRWAPAP